MHNLTALQDAHLMAAVKHVSALAQWQHLQHADPGMFRALLVTVAICVIILIGLTRSMFRSSGS